MVQGETMSYSHASTSHDFGRSQEARKAGFDAMRKKEEERKRMQEQEKQKQSYGSWGPVLKDKKHFASLHHC